MGGRRRAPPGGPGRGPGGGGGRGGAAHRLPARLFCQGAGEISEGNFCLKDQQQFLADAVFKTSFTRVAEPRARAPALDLNFGRGAAAAAGPVDF